MRTFLRLIRFLEPYRFRVALAVFLGVATVVGNVGLLATAAYVISAAAIVPFLSLLAIPVFLVRFFSVSRSFSRYSERLVAHDVTFRLLGNVRTWFYSRLTPLAPAGLQDYRGGDLLSRIVRDVEELENVYLRATAPVAIAVLTSALTFALLCIFSVTLAFATLGFLAACGVGAPLLVAALSRGLGKRQLELRAELNARIVDGVQGAQDLLAFGQEEAQHETIAALNRKLDRLHKRTAFVSGLQNSLGDLTMNLAVVCALVVASPLVAESEIRGVYLAFLALVVLGSFEAVQPLGSAFQFLGRSLSAGERLFEVADSEPAVRDPERPHPLPESFVLEFDRVGFCYEEGGPPALEDVSFVLGPGRKVAVVGPSGAGKSTVASLILRFWDPTQGEIRLGGRDIRDHAQEDVRSLVALVPQNAHVFNDTLRANLLLANPEATDPTLRGTLSRAGLCGFLEGLPRGLDAYLGEGGARLSGGERQRLAVARAFLKSAPLLVLDEPTANLDTVTEREVFAAAGELARGRSALVITHRLVGMEVMDEILVLDAGRVVERGTHEELARAGGLYRRLLDVQGALLARAGA
ncbi:MAG TPA: thiol reductant ABC exporter subunit CydC [Rubrobacteraceae bacterium]|nr:thiol reductant ABC exporter subunit CydC [Rubrobacteraceae bacterium]